MVAELFDKVREYAKQHPLIASAVFIAVAPNIIFGLLFSVLGFIGWGRIFLLILIGLGYGAYKLVKSNVMVELIPFREEEDF
jgi:hypothetical protein